MSSRSSGAAASPARFGLFLGNQQPRGTDMVAALSRQIELVHLVADQGWDSLWTGQHFLTDSSSQMSPTVALARLCPEAGHLEIGLGVLLLAILNPVDVAEQVASLDVVSGGRAVLGVGLGYRAVEFGAFGVDRSDARYRFVENLRVVRALLAGEAVDADLPWCRLEGASLSILPARKPRLPIFVAANADAAVRRAARLGDAWLVNPHTTIATVARQLDMYRAVRREEGLGEPLELPLIREVVCAATDEAAQGLAGRHLGDKYRAYAAWGQDTVLPDGESFDLPFSRLAERRFVVGTPESCLAQLMPWRTVLGVNHFILRTHWAGMDVEDAARSIRLLSDEVMPALRQAEACSVDRTTVELGPQ